MLRDSQWVAADSHRMQRVNHALDASRAQQRQQQKARPPQNVICVCIKTHAHSEHVYGTHASSRHCMRCVCVCAPSRAQPARRRFGSRRARRRRSHNRFAALQGREALACEVPRRFLQSSCIRALRCLRRRTNLGRTPRGPHTPASATS